MLVRNEQLKMEGLANKGTMVNDASGKLAKPRGQNRRTAQRNRKKKGAAGGRDRLPSDGIDAIEQRALGAALGQEELKEEDSVTAEIAEVLCLQLEPNGFYCCSMLMIVCVEPVH